MKLGDAAKLLGISPNRIKYFMRKEVFRPEHPSAANKPTDYTEHDVAELKKLVVLSRLGLTCSDIKKLQYGRWTLREAVLERRKAISTRWRQMNRSMELTESIIKDGVTFEAFDANSYWVAFNQIVQPLNTGTKGERGYLPIPSIRKIQCPYCKIIWEVDLEDYVVSGGVVGDALLGDERVDIHEIDSNLRNRLSCPSCGMPVRVHGWIREHPNDVIESEEIIVE